MNHGGIGILTVIYCAVAWACLVRQRCSHLFTRSISLYSRRALVTSPLEVATFIITCDVLEHSAAQTIEHHARPHLQVDGPVITRVANATPPSPMAPCIDPPIFVDLCQSVAIERNIDPEACMQNQVKNCCGCKALQAQLNEPTSLHTVESNCTNTIGYVDMYGDSCEYYEAPQNYPQACQAFGESGEEGLTPNQNCCVCHELMSPLPKPTLHPASSSTCIDTPGYIDMYGDGCEYYAAPENYPQACQAFGNSGGAGLTPNDNCCACQELIPPSTQPTLQPTICIDTPGFVDAYGFGCGYYVDDYPAACIAFGSVGDVGLTPNENCCACKDGLKPPSPQVTEQPTPCADTPGYLDIYGDGCNYYAAPHNHPQACQAFGNTGEEGLTPNDNCCVCKALVDPSLTLAPSRSPSNAPTRKPTIATADAPSRKPIMTTGVPSVSPSDARGDASSEPSSQPSSGAPTKSPVLATETSYPTFSPTVTPTSLADIPTLTPTSRLSSNETEVALPEKWWPQKMGGKPVPWEPEYIQCVYGDDYPVEFYTNEELRERMLFESRDECCTSFSRVGACRPTMSPTVAPTPLVSGSSRRCSTLFGIAAGLAVLTCVI